MYCANETEVPLSSEIREGMKHDEEASIAPTAATLSGVAEHLGLSRTAARDLEIQGVIDRTAGLGACRLAYIRHLRSRRPSGGAMQERILAAKARAIELRNAQTEHKLVPVGEAQEALDTCMGWMISELMSMPAAVTRDLALRRTMEDWIYHMRERVCSRIKAHADALEQTGKAANSAGVDHGSRTRSGHRTSVRHSSDLGGASR
jgi:hypothetical protein